MRILLSMTLAWPAVRCTLPVKQGLLGAIGGLPTGSSSSVAAVLLLVGRMRKVLLGGGLVNAESTSLDAMRPLWWTGLPRPPLDEPAVMRCWDGKFVAWILGVSSARALLGSSKLSTASEAVLLTIIIGLRLPKEPSAAGRVEPRRPASVTLACPDSPLSPASQDTLVPVATLGCFESEPPGEPLPPALGVSPPCAGCQAALQTADPAAPMWPDADRGVPNMPPGSTPCPRPSVRL